MILGNVNVVIDGLIRVVETGILHRRQLPLGISKYVYEVTISRIVRRRATWLDDQSVGVQVRGICGEHCAHGIVKYVLRIRWSRWQLVHEPNPEMVPSLQCQSHSTIRIGRATVSGTGIANRVLSQTDLIHPRRRRKAAKTDVFGLRDHQYV